MKVFKAYDIRGLVPDELDERLAGDLGRAFALLIQEAEVSVQSIVIGRDMRSSSSPLAGAFSSGARSQGMDVVDIGLASTDLVYFASGHLGIPAAVVTASHNPAGYNGFKLCLSGAKPVGWDTGLARIAELVEHGLPEGSGGGSAKSLHLLDEFVAHVRTFVDPERLRRLKVVADTANGMAGMILPAVCESLPFELEILYGQLDGEFPNHPADPIRPENLRDLQSRVAEVGADVGIAFDGDGDRVFLIDETARPVSGSLTTALVASEILRREPKTTIIHNLICSRAVAEVVRERGGRPLRSRVGHSYIKAAMAAEGASFAGEHSGHYYFRDNFGADSGIIAALIVLEVLSGTSKTLSELLVPFDRYTASGEINFQVEDPVSAITHVAKFYSDHPQDRLDGLTVDVGDWWFNLRPSNTEPLLRLNLESMPFEDCGERVAEVERLINEYPQGEAMGVTTN